MAKHCAKRLPATCSVLAVSNGKIVFRREMVSHAQSKGNLLLFSIEVSFLL